MKFRKATLEDIPEIDEVYVGGSIDEGKFQFPKVPKKEMVEDLAKHKEERIAEYKKDILSKYDYWVVAKENIKVIGFGQAKLKDYKYDKGYAEIDKIYVKRKFRGKGVAKKIERELVKWLRKKRIGAVGVRIYHNNKPSIRFHKKAGYKLMAIRMERKLR